MVFENYPVDRDGLAAASKGLRLGRVEGRDATHYPLALIVQPGETLHLRLDYRPDLFDAATVEALGRRLIRLLEAAVADPERALGALPILEPAERDTILRRWNDTAHGAGDARARRRRDPAGAVCGAGCCARRMAAAVMFEDRGAELRRARRPRQPAGASSAEPRRRAGDAGRAAAPSARSRLVVGLLGDPQGRRRLPAARPGLSARAAGRHGGGCGPCAWC